MQQYTGIFSTQYNSAVWIPTPTHANTQYLTPDANTQYLTPDANTQYWTPDA